MPGVQRFWKPAPVGRKVWSPTRRALSSREVVHLGWSRFFDPVIGAGDATAGQTRCGADSSRFVETWAHRDPSVWYMGDTALDSRLPVPPASRVLIGNADHDGGVERAAPRIHFTLPMIFAHDYGILHEGGGLLECRTTCVPRSAG